MVALSFKTRFAPRIIAREKRHTIRAVRKRPIVVGEKLQLYTGMRTRHCRLIGTAQCTAAPWITIDFVSQAIMIQGHPSIRTAAKLDAFAVLDGFRDWADMRRFWQKPGTEVQVFSGVMIRWGSTFRPAEAAL